MSAMLITNATVVTWESPNRILAEHAVLVEDGKIAALGPSAALRLRYPQADLLDARGQYLMPGNICAHTHFYGAFARGMAIPGAAPEDFPEILAKLWWPLDQALDREDVYYSALVCLADAIHNGTTTLIDHHASPNAIAGSLDEIARAVTDSGVRAALCYEVTDRGGAERASAGIEENVRFLIRVKDDNCLGRLGAMFGLHASLTLSDETLRASVEAARRIGDEVGFHIHVAEHPADEYDALAKAGTRVIDRLHRFGILGPNTLAVHCVHVDAREIDLLAESGTWVSHQPRSNMNNGVGLPPVESMLRAGVKVCLGNDGFTNAQWEEWKAAYLAHKLIHRDPRRMSAGDIAQMAMANNAELAQRLFNVSLGQIAPGQQADLILVDYQPFTPVTPGNLPWHIMFGISERMITTTIVAGKVLMRDRVLTTLDEERIAAQARIRAVKTWERYRRFVSKG